MSGSGRILTRTVNQAIWMLEKAISSENSFSYGIEISIGGWRIRRRRLIPFWFQLNGAIRKPPDRAVYGHLASNFTVNC